MGSIFCKMMKLRSEKCYYNSQKVKNCKLKKIREQKVQFRILITSFTTMLTTTNNNNFPENGYKPSVWFIGLATSKNKNQEPNHLRFYWFFTRRKKSCFFVLFDLDYQFNQIFIILLPYTLFCIFCTGHNKNPM
jgi:hypothetical protein